MASTKTSCGYFNERTSVIVLAFKKTPHIRQILQKNCFARVRILKAMIIVKKPIFTPEKTGTFSVLKRFYYFKNRYIYVI